MTQMSRNRYLYSVDITDKKEIDKELLNWLDMAHNLKQIK